MHLPFHSLETSRLLADPGSSGRTNLQDSFINAVVKLLSGGPAMLVTGPGNTFWLDSRVVIRSGENLIGKPTELVLTMQRIGMYCIVETLCIGEKPRE
jgi:uncharacterized protein YodC (DUF2158 family)